MVSNLLYHEIITEQNLDPVYINIDPENSIDILLLIYDFVSSPSFRKGFDNGLIDPFDIERILQ